MDLSILYKLSYGVYIVGSKLEQKLNAQVATAVFQVTAEPAQVAVSINKQNFTHDCIRSSKVVSISVLSEYTPIPIIGHFGYRSGRTADKFEGVEYMTDMTGAPVVSDVTIAYVELKIDKSFDAGTHTIFLGEVVNLKKLSDDPPMTYDHYHRVKGGKSPKAAPTYIQSETSS